MKILQCPNCAAKFDVSRHQPGRKVRCGRCKSIMEVPAHHPSNPVAVATPPRTPALAEEKTFTAKKPTGSRQTTLAASVHHKKGITAGSRLQQISAPTPLSKLRIATIIVLVAAGAGVLAYLMTREDPRNVVGTPQWLADRKSEYHQRYYELNKSNPDEVAALYQWCKQWPTEAFATEAEELLQLLCALKPDHPAAAIVRTKYEQKLVEAMQLNTEDAWIAVAEFCSKFSMKQECSNAANAVLKINPDNARANELLGRIPTVDETGKTIWEDRAVVEERLRLEREKQAKIEEEKKLGSRGRKIITACEKRFKQLMETVSDWKIVDPAPDLRIENKTWVILDRRPYVYIMEKGGYSPSYVLDWVHPRLSSLRKYFMEVYVKGLDIQESEDDMLTIFYFMGRESYRRRTGIHKEAAAHYNRSTRAFYIPHESDVSERDKLLYHEAIHQLMDFVGGYRAGWGRPFWFEEGNATFFETFATWKANCPPSEVPPNFARLSAARDLIQHKEYVPFEDVLDKPFLDARIGYPQGWAMVFFFNTYQSGKYRKQWEEFMCAELRGKGGKEVFKDIFGDPAALEKEWTEYILSPELMKEE